LMMVLMGAPRFSTTILGDWGIKKITNALPCVPGSATRLRFAALFYRPWLLDIYHWA